MTRRLSLRAVEAACFVVAALTAVLSLRDPVLGYPPLTWGTFPFALAALATGFAASGAVSLRDRQVERAAGALLGLSGVFVYTLIRRHWYETAVLAALGCGLLLAVVVYRAGGVEEFLPEDVVGLLAHRGEGQEE
ncbi:hypothetical protein [Haloarchaeobius sp. DFWS5]|uniref:hypothetical protein n=1 Tax=Haloarchaeobius sp. DFWS5 TaxID=3446114 RepID=UPI003EB7364E